MAHNISPTPFHPNPSSTTQATPSLQPHDPNPPPQLPGSLVKFPRQSPLLPTPSLQSSQSHKIVDDGDELGEFCGCTCRGLSVSVSKFTHFLNWSHVLIFEKKSPLFCPKKKCSVEQGNEGRKQIRNQLLCFGSVQCGTHLPLTPNVEFNKYTTGAMNTYSQ